VISPQLANIFLHYILDLWVQQWRKRYAKGDIIYVRWADDFVMGFQYQKEAKQFNGELRERLKKFKLELHDGKTRIIEFGRFAERDRTNRNESKPETFDFLGFTHICGKTRKTGKFTIRRKPSRKRQRRLLKRIKETLRTRINKPVLEQGKWLKIVIQGYLNYYAVPGTCEILSGLRKTVCQIWLKSLRRRSHKARKLTWQKAIRLFDTWIPKVKILHPYPNERLRV